MIRTIPDLVSGARERVGDLTVALLHPGRRMDPVYHALVIAAGDDAVVYAPHGFALNRSQIESVAHLRIRLLITTIMTYKLPAWLGGEVNPGSKQLSRWPTNSTRIAS